MTDPVPVRREGVAPAAPSSGHSESPIMAGMATASEDDDLTINLEALADVHPAEPRQESKAVLKFNRLSHWVPGLYLVAWAAFVVGEVIVRWVSSTPGEGVGLLFVGGSVALLGGVVAPLAFRAKQSDREAGKTPRASWQWPGRRDGLLAALDSWSSAPQCFVPSANPTSNYPRTPAMGALERFDRT